jgi:predicted AAA+ superfamily ATPase
LTGSSSRKLKRGTANLLAGRALTYHLHPLTATEIGKSFDLTQAITTGLLPLSYLEPDSKNFLESYVATYLREEVIQEGLVRNIGAFSRFMEIASFSQGSLLNLSNISREVGVSRKIIENYFDILSDLLIGIQIPCFTKRATRELTQHPKFYYFDVGVYRQLRPKGPLDSPEEIGGVAFETLFLQHLRAIIDYYELDLSIYYWRTQTGVEVDFIVYGEKGLFAFELKSRRYIERKDFSALKIFKQDYDIAQCYLIYSGERVEQFDGLTALPMQQALFKLPEILAGNDSG